MTVIGEFRGGCELVFGNVVAFEADGVLQTLVEIILHICEFNSVVGAFRACEARPDAVQVELHDGT